MKKQLLIPLVISFFILIQEKSVAQNYNMGNSSVSTCTGNFRDSGGNGIFGDYGNNENYTMTFCSSIAGQCVRMTFTAFNVENTYDFLYIFNGPNTGSPLIGVYTGTNNPGTVTGTTGCLTFVFTSDISVVSTGWNATISCIACSGGGPCGSTCSGGPAPANDACAGAQNLGAIPTPANCPNGIGAWANFNTTNLCATAESPYTSLTGCQPAGNMASPSADVWYRFTITGPTLNISISGLQTPNVGLYSGTLCNNLIPRGCAIGGGGILNTQFGGLAAGTYYLQVSGGSLTDQCNFTLSIQNNYDCAGCVITSSLTVNPPPVNGTYMASQSVTFCYTVSNYNQTSINWLHAVTPTFGPGWDMSTLTTVPANDCDGQGFWQYYNQTFTSTATGLVTGPGFFYDTPAGDANGGYPDGNPGDNFGDNNPVNACDWTFCWTITTLPPAQCVQGASLNISIDTYGDGESGSWTSLACTGDPVSEFFATLACCEPPVIGTTDVICFGQSNGTATGQGQGTGPWDYVWQNAAGTTIFTQSNLNGSSLISNLPAGNYTLFCTDNAGCVASAPFTIIQPAVIAPTPNSSNVTCNGAANGSISLNPAGGNGGYSYQWSSPFGNVATVNNLAPGNYTVTVTDVNGCTASATINIAQPAVIAFNTIVTPASCAGNTGSITINANGGTGALQYSINGGTTFQAGNVFNSLGTGNYNVVVQDASGCQASAIVAVNAATAPVINSTPFVNITCNGGTNGSIIINAAGGTGALQYSINGGSSFQAGNTFNGLPAGAYNIVVQDAVGCQVTAAVNIIQPTPIVVNPGSVSSTCGNSNGSITINANGGTGALQYSINNGASYQAANIFNGLTANNYNIVVQDANGCTATGNVAVANAAGPTITSVGSTNVNCNGGTNGTITINTNGGLPPVQCSIDGGATYQAGNNFAGLPVGNYNVAIIDGNGCTATGVVNIAQPAPLNVNGNTVDATCGSSNGSITVNANGGVGALQYSNDGGATYQAGNIFNGVPAGNYNVVVQDANGCTGSAVIAVNNAAAPVINSTPFVNINCNGGNNGSIVINGSGGTGALQYSINNGATFQAGNTFNNLTAGIYDVVIQDANGCQVATSINIIQPPAIVVNPNSVTSTCGNNNGSININANGGTGAIQYSIDNGATFQAGNIFNGLATGNYNIVVQDANGCTSTSVIAVGSEPSPVIVSVPFTDVTCDAGSDGTIVVNSNGGTGAILYSIDGGTTFQGANAFNGLPAGAYNIIVQDANGCTATSNVNINQPAAVAVNPNSVTATCGNSNGSININANGGTGALQYSIDGGAIFQAGNIFNGLGSGNYNIVVQDANGCTGTGNISVADAPGPALTSTPFNNVNCFAGNDGSIVINANGGTGALQFSIDGGTTYQALNNFNNLTAGSYTVVVQDVNGCTVSTVININQPPQIVFNSVPVNTTCSNSNGSITINANGGSGTLQYSINGGANYQASNTFNGIAAGAYNIVVEDANGCTASAPLNIIDAPPPVIASAPVTDVSCNGGNNGAIVVNGNGGTGALQYSIDGGTTFQAGNNFNGLPTGNYNIVVQDANGCTVTAVIAVAEPNPLVVNSNSTVETCGNSNGTLVINANGGTGALQYSNDNGAAFQASNTFNNITGGNYNVIVQDANGCTASIIAAVLAEPAPVISSAPVVDVICNAGTNGSIVINSNGGTGAIQYSIDGGVTYQAGNTFSGLPAGNYSIVIQDANGCTTTDNAVIAEPSALVVNPNAVTATCSNSNGSININANGGTGAIQFSIDGGTSYQAGNTFNGLASGNYSIVVQDANGCTATSNINVPDATSPTITSNPVTDVSCNAGSNGSIIINSNGGTGAIQYSIDGGTIYQAGNTFNGLPAGNYSIIIQDINGCTATANANIAQPTALVVNPNAVTATCSNNNGSINISANGGTGVIQYSIDNGATYQAGNNFNGLATGNYSIVVQDANGCTATSNINVPDAASPVIASTPVVDVTCNSGTNGSIVINSNGGTGAIQYSIDGGTTYQAGNTFNGLPAGNYSIIIQDVNGCTATANANIAQPTALVVNPNAVTATCSNNNGSININANGGTGTLQYSIDNGTIFQASNNFNGLASGNYNIVVQDANGCTASSNINVLNAASPTISSNPVTDVSCNAGSNGSIIINSIGGTGAIQYSIDGGTTYQAANTFNGLPAGNYSIIIQDANGCTATSNANIAQPTALVVNPNSVTATCSNNNGSININANGGTGTIQYSIDNGTTFQASNNFNGLASGNYSIVVQDANGCTATSNINVPDEPSPTIVSIPVVDATCNAGTNGSIAINSNGGTGAIQYSIDGGTTYQATNTFNGLPAGNYSIIIQDVNGCTAAANAIIAQPTAVAFNSNTVTATCGSSNGSITINGNGGTGTLQYSIDGGTTFQAGNIFNGLPAGNYNIVVQDANNCAANGVASVNNALAPAIASAPVFDVTCNTGTNGSITVNANGGTGALQYSIDNGVTFQAGNIFNNLPAGNYNIVVQDVNGCVASSAAIINEPSAVVLNANAITATCSNNNGSININANGGTGAIQYSIDNGTTYQAGGAFNNLPTGNYSIIVQDANGCTAFSNINVPNAPSPTILSTPVVDVTCYAGINGAITINSNGGTGAIQYSIDNGTTYQAGNNFNGLPAGNYQIIIQDINGCTATANANIVQPTEVVFNTNTVTATCNGSNGSININANGGTGTLQYSIDGGSTFQTGNVFNGLPAGNYNIVVQDANNCQANGVTAVNNALAPVISSTPVIDVTCNGGANGSIVINANGGTGALQFSIDNGASYQAGNIFNNLPAGNYNLVVQDANSCSTTSVAAIIQPTPVVANSNTTTSTCGNNNGTIIVNGNGGTGSLQYSIDGGLTFQASNNFISLAGGNYNIVVQDANGCTASALAVVNSEPSPVIISAPVIDVSCNGGTDGSIAINITGGTGAIQYSIDGGTTFQPSNNFSNLPGGNYNVVVQDVNGCTVTSNAVVAQPAAINFNTVITDASCGNSDGTIAVLANGGNGGFQYSIDGGITFQGAVLFNGLLAGNYNVIVQDVNGCTATNVAVVNNAAAPAISSAPFVDVTCNGGSNGSIIVNANGGTGALMYSIDNGVTFSPVNTFNNLPAGTYNLIVQDANGCQASASIDILEPTAVVFNANAVTATCGNNNGSVDINANGGTGVLEYSIDGGTTFQPLNNFNNLASGNYNIVVQDANGCSATSNINVPNAASPAISSTPVSDVTCNGGADGSLAINSNGGTGAIQFSIDNGVTYQPGNIFNNLPAGNYSIIIQDANGCTATSNAIIIQPAAINFNTLITDASCNQSDGTISVLANGGSGALQYSIDGGATFQSGQLFNNLLAGNYSIVVQDANGCTTSNAAVVNNAAAPAISSSPFIDVSCNGGSNGSIVVNANGGTGALMYSIDNGVTFSPANIFNTLPAGNYSIIVQDASGCQASANVIINEPAAVVFNANAATSTCGNNNGSIAINANGGTGVLQYSIDNGTTFQAGSNFNSLTTGNYNIIVQDANGCSAAGNIIVTDEPSPTISLVNATDLTCNGSNDGTISITSNGGTGALEFSVDGGTTFQPTNNFSNLPIGNYNIIVRDANGCTAASNAIIAQPSPVAINSNTVQSTCGSSNGEITINANGGSGNYQFSIDNGVTFQPGNIFNGLPAGNYNVVVQDGSGCTSAALVAVVNAASPIINSAPLVNASCFGLTDGSITVNATGGIGVLQYSIDNGVTYQPGNIFNNLPAGPYSIVVQDANGCTISSSVSIIEPPQININSASSSSSCGGSDGSVTVNANGGTGALQISIDGGVTFQPGSLFPNLSAGNYNVVVQDATGCQATSVASVNNINGPVISNTASTDLTCFGSNNGTIVITANGGTGALNYSIDNGTTYQITNSFNNLTGGVFSIVVMDGSNCLASANVLINEPTQVVFNALVTDATCGNSNGTINVFANGGTGVLQYSNNNGSSYQAGALFGSLLSGNYTVVVQDANGCTAAALSVVPNQASPVISTTNVVDVSCNGGNDGTLNITANGGTGALQFSIDNGVSFFSSNIFNNLPAGPYNIIIQDVNGCTATSAANIVEPTVVAANANAVTATCGNNNGSININANGGTGTLQYSIDGGTTFQSLNNFNNLAAGNYNIVVQDVNGCSAATAAVVNNAASPVISSAIVTDVLCNGGSNGTLVINVNGGTGALQYSIDGGTTFQSSGNFNGLTVGNYNIIVQDVNGCTAISAASIIEPAAINVNSNSNPASCGNPDGSVLVNANGGAGGFQYSINGGAFQVGNLFNNLLAGNYSVVVQDANGCTMAGAALVANTPDPLISASFITDVLCNGGNSGAIDITAGSGTGTLLYSIDNGTTFQLSNIFNGLPAGNYNIVVQDALGCQVAAIAAIAEPTAVVANANTVTATCEASNGSILINANGGTGTLQYSIDGGVTFQSLNNFNGLPGGNYNVVVQDANGCTSATAAFVSNAASPVISSAAITDVLCNGGSDGTLLINANGGTGALQYSIDGGTIFQPGNNFVNLPIGNYNIIVQDVNGCTAASAAIIVEPSAINVNSNSNAASCGDNDGSVLINANGGTGAFQYSINGGTFQVGNLFSNLFAGNYNVVVQDANGCTEAAIAAIVNTTAPVISATNLTDVNCNGDNNGSIILNANGGTGALMYSIDNGTTFQLSNSFNGLIAGAYSIIVQDALGCQVLANANIVEPTAVVVNSNATIATCGNNNGTISVNASGGTGALQYSIDGGTTFISASNFNNLAPGNYSIVVQDANGCTASAAQIINSAPAPVINAVNAIDITCYGYGNGSITINSTGGSGAVQYSIDGGTTFQSSNNFSNLNIGNYNIVVLDTNGCTAISTAAIAQPAAINLNPSSLPVSCFGGNNGTTSVIAGGGISPYTYSWSVGGTNSSANNLSAGTYTVTVTDANNCTATASAIVIQPAALALNSSFTDVLCFGGSNGNAGVIMAGGTTPYTYLWSNSNTTSNASGLLAGNYSVVVTDANSCTISQAFIINEPPVLAANTVSAAVDCFGGNNGTLTVAPVGGTSPYSYQWSSGSTLQTAGNLAVGYYSVIITDANGCTMSVTDSVTSPSALVINSTPVGVTCFGMNNGSVNAVVTGGVAPYAYLWSNGATTTSVSGLPGGVYKVTVTDFNSCVSQKTSTVTEPQQLVLTVSDPDTICISQATTVSAVVTGGTAPYTYVWNNGSTSTSQSVSPGTTTTYIVNISDANGCTVTQQSVTITVNPPLTVIASADNAICEGQNAVISAIASGGSGGPYTYSWNNNAGNNSSSTVSPILTTTYTVNVNDNCGTPVATDQVTIVVNPLPDVLFTLLPADGCVPLKVVFSDISTTPAGSQYLWSFGDGSSDSLNNPIHTYYEPGTYTVSLTITTPFGCISVLTMPNAVKVHSLPVASFSSDPGKASILHPVIEFRDMSIDAAVWNWDFGDAYGVSAVQHPEYTYRDIGKYIVTLIVLNEFYCADTAHGEVFIEGAYTTWIPNAFSPNGDGKNDFFHATGIGINDIQMYIYDRWGQIVFSTDNMKNPWDGRNMSDRKECPEDVYVYLVKVVDLNNESHELTGRVTLVR